jgi:hypothetical protein
MRLASRAKARPPTGVRVPSLIRRPIAQRLFGLVVRQGPVRRGEHAKDGLPVIEEFHRQRPRLFMGRPLHPFAPRAELIPFFFYSGA